MKYTVTITEILLAFFVIIGVLHGPALTVVVWIMSLLILGASFIYAIVLFLAKATINKEVNALISDNVKLKLSDLSLRERREWQQIIKYKNNLFGNVYSTLSSAASRILFITILFINGFFVFPTLLSIAFVICWLGSINTITAVKKLLENIEDDC